jgi:hypothetical protein
MTNVDRTKPTSIPIKGSWEDLISQAHRAASNQKDDAIALYGKIMDGLRRLPLTQRQAQQGRLQELLKTATANLHVYLTQRERYDEALSLLPTLYEMVDEDEQKSWQQRAAMVLAQAGRTDEALASLRSLAAGDAARLSDWGNLVTQHTKLKQFFQAREVLDEAAAWSAQRRAADGRPAGDATTDEAYLAHLQCVVALASGEHEEGIAHYEWAAQLDKTYKERPHLLYSRLIFYDQLESALKYVQRDSKHPVRAGLWYGVVQKRLGKPAEARRQWEGVVKALTPQTDNEQFFELVLSFYYLGDPEGRGLGGVLRALQSGGSQGWVLLFLAGLGWMLRDNLKSARTNFALALARRRANAEGTKLSAEVWQHCKDLLSEEQQTQIIEYFSTEP